MSKKTILSCLYHVLRYFCLLIMITITTRQELKNHLSSLGKDISTGFVPTMGTLHQGHVSLLKRAQRENDLTVVSIFINPTQFNDPNDFKLYPRNYNDDAKKLELEGCDILLLPSFEEVYPDSVVDWIEESFGSVEEVMEGRFRPGHFKGVKTVVYRLFQLVKPTRSYFGEKDYQQLRIIQKLVKRYNLKIEIVPCPTEREPDGLAMSSRNKNLSKESRTNASAIPEILKKALLRLKSDSVENVRAYVDKSFKMVEGLQLEYFEIANAETLLPVKGMAVPGNTRVFVAAYAGEVRLIDNIAFTD